jgi:L-rhamnose mutarotase
MLLDKFTEMVGIYTKLLNKTGKVYFKLQNKSKSLGLVPTEVVYAKTAALQYVELIKKDNIENFYFFVNDGEYLFVIWDGTDNRRPWMMMHFLDEGAKSGELYSDMLEVEFLSDKSGDIQISFVPSGFHMEIYDDMSYDLFTNEEWNQIIAEESSAEELPETENNVIVGDFKQTAA